MTLLFVDGFDHYNTADITKKWSSINGSPDINTTGGRRGGGACYFIYAEYIQRTINDAGGIRYTIGFAFKFTSTYSGLRYLMRMPNDTGGSEIVVMTNNTYNLNFYCNSFPGLVHSTSDSPISLSVWHYLELKFEIGDGSNGHLEAYFDAVQLFTWSGDNRWTGSSNIKWIRIFGPNNNTYIDDLYLLDELGSKNTTFLGPCRVDTIRPSGAGNYAQMTPSAGANYECVDDDQLSESDYVASDNHGEKDSYEFDEVPAVIYDDRFYGVQTCIAAAKQNPTSVQLADLVRIGGNDYNGDFNALTESDLYNLGVKEVDPSDSNDWTKAKVNASEFGQETLMPALTTTTT